MNLCILSREVVLNAIFALHGGFAVSNDDKRLESIEAKLDELRRYIVGDPDTTGLVTRLDRVEQKITSWSGYGIAVIVAVIGIVAERLSGFIWGGKP